MAERPRSRLTIFVGLLTIAAMMLIALIFLLIQSPWNDPGPRPLHKSPSLTKQTPVRHS